MSQEIQIQIRYKLVKNITIRVKTTGEVILTAPIGTSKSKIDEIINLRKQWIEKHLERFSLLQEKQKLFTRDNNQIEFLGHFYNIKILYSLSESVNLSGNDLIVTVNSNSTIEHRRELIDQWYYNEALRIFSDMISTMKSLVNKPVNHLSIKRMTTRWGSCNHTKGYINLNIELIKKPIAAIEYVILHELTHLIYPNHSDNFYRYIELHMHDWKERSKLLNNHNFIV